MFRVGEKVIFNRHRFKGFTFGEEYTILGKGFDRKGEWCIWVRNYDGMTWIKSKYFITKKELRKNKLKFIENNSNLQ